MHIILVPFTKVEESFNTNAIHDILYHKWNISEYDHHEFPGVVPRTFFSPLIIGLILSPVISIINIFHGLKIWGLYASRMCIGSLLLLSFLNFVRTVEKYFGKETALFLRLITASQFHFIFYASRPLPNTFAFIVILYIYSLILDEKYIRAIKLATFTTFILRFDTILFFGPLFIPILVTKKVKFISALYTGIISLIVSLLITIPLDSLFWKRLIYPEGEVIIFNIFENKSHLYGTSPFYWYFLSALPRALQTSYILVPLGIFYEKRLYHLFFSAITFITLYSFLPHKELRFIIYTIPLFNLIGANFMARSWINKEKSISKRFFSYGLLCHLILNSILTFCMIYISSRNYAGGDAINHLQYLQRFDRNKHIKIHIDEFAAQTGISKFLHYYDNWEYNKTESLQLNSEKLKDFNFIILGDYNTDVKKKAQNIFSKTHRQYFGVEAFHKINFIKTKKFPYYIPRIKFMDKLIVLRRKGDA
ncbi:Dol-P-Man:Man(7)GlcNAc(2)-PP-Dol alpha-1,6-mannosyltransferase [Strongyloides ratti]|uniref:Mannosyltransferase n=1 Tax=Strongyloides ratti TaxID=34506 RepID=A0A090LL95_STRRB|nr:Dol-P-Man:Man(7)GlcNAc(2)-PP-Dol alpha-1,6-mannosyltransferase [Strongyloides ratti]CEF70589.1 Dol-P-Man:Man(7)GlcNAc(2)-PP-Dol alpha-1,6-mannosyltransferase [Strongyloides ratti]